jgi:hypothetical protein
MIMVFLILLLVIIILYSQNEQFNNEEKVCANIPEGECNSKLCSSNCKIKPSIKTPNMCYCTERK